MELINKIKHLIVKNKKIFLTILIGICILIIFNIVNFSIYKKTRDNINNLHDKNKILKQQNDSIILENKKLDDKIKYLYDQIVINKQELIKTDNKLKELKQKRNEIPNYVDKLSNDDVANTFTEIIKKREQNKNSNN